MNSERRILPPGYADFYHLHAGMRDDFVRNIGTAENLFPGIWYRGWHDVFRRQQIRLFTDTTDTREAVRDIVARERQSLPLQSFPQRRHIEPLVRFMMKFTADTLMLGADECLENKNYLGQAYALTLAEGVLTPMLGLSRALDILERVENKPSLDIQTIPLKYHKNSQFRNSFDLLNQKAAALLGQEGPHEFYKGQSAVAVYVVEDNESEHYRFSDEEPGSVVQLRAEGIKVFQGIYGALSVLLKQTMDDEKLLSE
ncbi:hypothetical protein HY468_01290 [Candidatus Roizmanbacteria bacterium]|nr:hypothetical protein [Candidatus Roizmanbacteria bacterium]